jgi:hypothetical protein
VRINHTFNKLNSIWDHKAIKLLCLHIKQDVISQSLAEFDRQRQMQEQQIRNQAIQSGAFGGGREGVQLAEFGAQSGRE